MGLKPLEFADCLLDSPYFRENIHDHERELEQTNEAIKGLIKECKSLLKATESKVFVILLFLYCVLMYIICVSFVLLKSEVSLNTKFSFAMMRNRNQFLAARSSFLTTNDPN